MPNIAEKELPSEIRRAFNSVSAVKGRPDRPQRNITSIRDDYQHIDSFWMSQLRKRVKDSRRRGQLIAEEPCTIFRVPENLREEDPKAYEPSVVSIGCLHTNDCHTPRRLQAMQEHKRRCVCYLLARIGDNRRASGVLNSCILEMKALEARARQCYAEHNYMGQSSSANMFAEMLLLDGCFILHLLLKQAAKKETLRVVVVRESLEGADRNGNGCSGGGGDDEEEALNLVNVNEEEEVPLLGNLWIWSRVKYDLLKLENQIPFFVVTRLFDLLKTPDDGELNLVELALKLFGTLHPPTSRYVKAIPYNEVHHLLHLFHLSLPPACCAKTPTFQAATPPPEGIPSATELRKAGVKFRMKENANSFLQIEFNNGVMEIPPLHIYNYSNSIFRNLIAFEQCFPLPPYITIYALFMECIMHAAEDVRLLHLKGIVLNSHSSDDEVARFFRNLCRRVHYAYDTNYLSDLFIKVRQYHKSRWHTWWAGLVSDYFGNPWVSLSAVAAVCILALAVLQTIFTILAYLKPSH